MTKPLVLAISLALLAPSAAFAAQGAPASQSAPAKPAAPAWVAKSNEFTQILLLAQAPFMPEQVSFFGVPGFDEQVFEFGPNYAKRYRDETAKAKAELLAKAAIPRRLSFGSRLAGAYRGRHAGASWRGCP